MLDVTDHAILRFLERAHGLPVEAMRADLSTRLNRAFLAAEKLGELQMHVVVDGLRFVVRDGKVTTVMLNDDPTYARRKGIARA